MGPNTFSLSIGPPIGSLRSSGPLFLLSTFQLLSSLAASPLLIWHTPTLGEPSHPHPPCLHQSSWAVLGNILRAARALPWSLAINRRWDLSTAYKFQHGSLIILLSFSTTDNSLFLHFPFPVSSLAPLPSTPLWRKRSYHSGAPMLSSQIHKHGCFFFFSSSLMIQQVKHPSFVCFRFHTSSPLLELFSVSCPLSHDPIHKINVTSMYLCIAM